MFGKGQPLDEPQNADAQADFPETVAVSSSGVLRPLLDMVPYAAVLVATQSSTIVAWNPLFASLCPNPPAYGKLLDDCGFAVSVATILQAAEKTGNQEWFSCQGLPSMVKLVCASGGYAVLALEANASWLSSVAVSTAEDFLDAFPNMVMLYNANSLLLGCNKAYCDFFGISRQEALGRKLGSFVTNNYKFALWEAVATCARTQEPREVVSQANHAGKDYWHLLSMLPLPASNGRDYHVLALCSDITAHRTLEAAISRQDKLLYGTNAVAQLLLSGQDKFEECVNRVLALLGQITGADRVYVWSIHESPCPEITTELHTTQLYEWSLGAEPQQNTDLCTNRLVSETIPTWIDIFMSGHCVNNIVKNMPKEEREQLEPQGIVSILTAPIFFHGELWGFIGFDDCHSEHIWSPSEENILMAAGSLIGAAIFNSRTMEALKESEMRFTMVAEATGEMIWSLDENLCLDYVSGKSAEILGYEPGELLGRHFSCLCPPDEGFEPSPLTPILRDTTVEVQRKDGSQCWLESSCFFVFDDKGKCCNAHGSSLDITEVRLAHTQIQLAKEELEAANEKLRMAAHVANRLAEEANMANQAKSDFLTNMSHELRTPLNAIMGMVYLLGKTQVNQQQQTYLTNVKAASESLLEIINDILDFTSIDPDSTDLEISTFSLEGMVQKAIEVPWVQALSKKLDFTLQVHPSLRGRFFDGDSGRLGRVLHILVTNAVKFTPQGAVAISVQADSASDAGAGLHFTVQDTGIGLSEQEQKRLFSVFMQADSSSTRQFGGTGMGLALSYKLVTLMGGSIWCSSQPGKGSTFHVTLNLPFAATPLAPFANDALPGAAEALGQDAGEGLSEEERLAGKLKGRTVLLVEDNEINQIVAEEILVQAGLEVTIANNGREALACVKNKSFDIVLMDIQMPEMDGITATRAIRDQQQYATLPIIALTAHARSEDKRLTLEAGMNDHITKPIEPDALLRCMAGHMQ